jgi:tetratricopeptide (TPR) repeat protein
VAATLIELGEDLLRLGRGAEAADQLNRAIEYAVKLADPSLERSARNCLGRALAASDDTEAAIGQLERAAAIAETHADAYELARAHHGLADVHRRRGNTEAERTYLRRAALGYAACDVPEAGEVAEQVGLV